MTYLYDLSNFVKWLGFTLKKATRLKIIKVRFMSSVKTHSKSGSKTWTNQQVAGSIIL